MNEEMLTRNVTPAHGTQILEAKISRARNWNF